MYNNKYRLSYLPLFYRDLEDKITYIAKDLKNPRAANQLLDKVEKAILERLPVAEAFEPYHSIKERKYQYYRIYINNFTLYYVVIDDDQNDKIMEVRRFLYNGQNKEKIL